MENAADIIARKMGKPVSKPGSMIEKLCPFMSTADKQAACTPQCKLYKPNSHGYECPVQELSAISFQLRTIAGASSRK